MEGNLILRRLASYLSLLVVALYVITGYGLTKSEIVERWTGGLLTKSLSFSIHNNLIWPLIALLLLHLYFSCGAIAKCKECLARIEGKKK